MILQRPLASLENTGTGPSVPRPSAPPSPLAFSAALQKAGPLEVQTLITELEYFSKLQGIAPGDKRKEEASTGQAGEGRRAGLPSAAGRRWVWSPRRRRPPPTSPLAPPRPPLGRAPTSTAQGPALPAGRPEIKRECELRPGRCGRGVCGGTHGCEKGCGACLFSPEQKSLDNSTSYLPA